MLTGSLAAAAVYIEIASSLSPDDSAACATCSRASALIVG
jgi:hypothetical protein